jgi:hypothetical protein
MNTLKKLFLTLAVLLSLAGLASAQSSLTYTTLSAKVTGGGGTPGSGQGQQTIQTVVTLASISGINAFGAGVAGPQGLTQGLIPQYNTYLLIDRELMAVLTVNSSTLQVTVQRGWQGTAVNPHNSGAVVIAGQPQQFAQIDPAGGCTAAGTLVSPVITVAAGATNIGNVGRQWICDSTTGNWLPVMSTGSITPAASAAAIGVNAQTFTVNGLVAGEPIAISVQPVPTTLCPLVGARVTATNTVTLYWSVLTAAACTPAAGVYAFFSPTHY